MDTCSKVSSLTAEVRVSGSVGGRPMRGRLLAGLASPSSARLEAAAPFGAPIFIFVAHDRDASLLLVRDDRVLPHADAAAVLEAIAGVPLSPSALRTTLTGCGQKPEPAGARATGDGWMTVPDQDGTLYLNRPSASARWQLAAVVHNGGTAPAWRAEYRDYANGLPRSVRLTSAPTKRFDLRLELSQVELNEPLGADVFQLRVPQTASPITLEELQRSGPLAEQTSSSR